VHERDAPEAELELRAELVSREIPLESTALDPVGVEDEYRRGPSRVEPVEPGRVLLDVGLDRQEVFVDEVRGLLVGVGLGFQPSACASGRGRAEVEKNRALRRLRLGERLVDVPAPLHCHW
jgi:hypothetical protein